MSGWFIGACADIFYNFLISQVTLTNEDNFKQGVMAFGEIGVISPSYDLTALYVNALKLGSRLSNFFMFGAIFGTGLNNATVYHTQFDQSSAAIILNDSVFYHFASNFVIGLETLGYFDTALLKQSTISFYPQFLLDITATLTLQAGVGFVFSQSGLAPELVFRIVSSAS